MHVLGNFGEHKIWQNGSLLVLAKFIIKFGNLYQIRQIKNLTRISHYAVDCYFTLCNNNIILLLLL